MRRQNSIHTFDTVSVSYQKDIEKRSEKKTKKTYLQNQYNFLKLKMPGVAIENNKSRQ